MPPSPMARAHEESRWTLVAFMLLASLLVHLLLWPVGDELVSLGWNSPPLPRTDASTAMRPILAMPGTCSSSRPVASGRPKRL